MLKLRFDRYITVNSRNGYQSLGILSNDYGKESGKKATHLYISLPSLHGYYVKLSLPSLLGGGGGGDLQEKTRTGASIIPE